MEGDFDIVDLLGRPTITDILAHYAQTTHVAAGMVRWSQELAEALPADITRIPSDFGERWRHLRVTRVINRTALCGALREETKFGDGCCVYSDAKYCEEAVRRGTPIVYRCHAGLIDFVCPVFIGTYHVANVYGGQLVLEAPDDRQNLLQHDVLERYVTTDHDCLRRVFPCLEEPTSDAEKQDVRERIDRDIRSMGGCIAELGCDRLLPLATQTIRMTPGQLACCIALLQDIAGFLSSLATEMATLRELQRVEEHMGEILKPQALQTYLLAAQRLVFFSKGVILFQNRQTSEVEIGGFTGVDYGAAESVAHSEVIAASVASQQEKDRVKTELIAPHLGGAGDEYELLPMQVGGRSLGCWLVDCNVPRPPQDRGRVMLAALAAFTARAGSFVESASEIDALGEIQRDVASVTTHPARGELPCAVNNGATQLYRPARSTGLWVFDYKAQVFRHVHVEGDPFNATDGIPLPYLDPETGEPRSLSAEAVRKREPEWQKQNDDGTWRLHCFPDICARNENRFLSVVSVPLLAGERIVGALNVHQKDRTEPTERERALLKAYGDSVAHAVQTWQLYDASQALDACQDTLDIEICLKEYTEVLLGARFGSLWHYRRDIVGFVLEGIWGYQRDVLGQSPPKPSDPIIRYWLEEPTNPERSHPVMVRSTDDAASQAIAAVHSGLEWWIMAPLISGGELLGILNLGFDRPRASELSGPEQRFLSSYAGYIATALQRTLAARKLRDEELLAPRRANVAWYARNTYLQAIQYRADRLRAAQHQCGDLMGAIDNVQDGAADTAGLRVCIEKLRLHQAQVSEHIAEIEECVRLIREDSPAFHRPASSSTTFSLRPIVEKAWSEVVGHCRHRHLVGYPTWEQDSFNWPESELWAVVKIVLHNAVQAINSISDDALRLRANALEPSQGEALLNDGIRIDFSLWSRTRAVPPHGLFTVWWQFPVLEAKEIDEICRDRMPAWSSGMDTGFRLAQAILRMAGGQLFVRRGKLGGTVVEVFIPTNCPRTL